MFFGKNARLARFVHISNYGAVQRGTVCLAPRPSLCLGVLTDLMLLSMIPARKVFESTRWPVEPPSCFSPASGDLCLGYLCWTDSN